MTARAPWPWSGSSKAEAAAPLGPRRRRPCPGSSSAITMLAAGTLRMPCARRLVGVSGLDREGDPQYRQDALDHQRGRRPREHVLAEGTQLARLRLLRLHDLADDG